VCEGFLSGNESHLASLNLRDAAADLRQQGLSDVGRNGASQPLFGGLAHPFFLDGAIDGQHVPAAEQAGGIKQSALQQFPDQTFRERDRVKAWLRWAARRLATWP